MLKIVLLGTPLSGVNFVLGYKTINNYYFEQNELYFFY